MARTPWLHPKLMLKTPMAQQDNAPFIDRSPQTSELGNKAELDKTTSAHSLWEHFQHGQEPALPARPGASSPSAAAGTGCVSLHGHMPSRGVTAS